MRGGHRTTLPFRLFCRLVAWTPKLMWRGDYYDLLDELEHVRAAAALALDALETDPEGPAARSYLYSVLIP